MARKKRRKDRVAKAAEEIWNASRYINIGPGPAYGLMVKKVYHEINASRIEGKAAERHLTVDELKAALAPKLLEERLDRAMGV
jgi:predicted metal-dependent hydrolase